MEITITEVLHPPTIATTTTTAAAISNAATAMVSDNVPILITMEVLASQAAVLELVLDPNKNLKKNNYHFP